VKWGWRSTLLELEVMGLAVQSPSSRRWIKVHTFVHMEAC